MRKLMIRLVLLQGGAVYAPYLIDGEQKIDLITPKHLDRLPNGTTLTCIDGKRVTKGVDYIDSDTRGGFLAYGLLSASKGVNLYVGHYRAA